nr:DUF4158 domain-containing protein [Streptomyces sp. ISL-66]
MEVAHLAEQLDIEDASVLKAYGERENTRLDHVRELRRLLEYRDSPRGGRSCGGGWTRGPGLPGRGRRRCSTRRWGGCASGGCCCRG